MKYKLICPKCESTEIIRPRGSKYNTSFRVSLDKWGSRFANIDRYICVNCGFTEEWVIMDDKFNKWVDSNWNKLNSEEGFV